MPLFPSLTTDCIGQVIEQQIDCQISRDGCSGGSIKQYHVARSSGSAPIDLKSRAAWFYRSSPAFGLKQCKTSGLYAPLI